MKLLKIAFGFFVLFHFTQFAVQGQDTNDHKEIEKKVGHYLKYFSKNNPGAVVTVMKEGGIVFNRAYGLSNIEAKEKNTIDKTFNLADISKSFTSLAILKLVEKGKLGLYDNILDIFPDFPQYGKKIQIKHLLSHTSGLKPYEEVTEMSNKGVLEILYKENETIFEPGTKSKYSNSDYALLAIIIEKISGMPYKDFLTKYIFKKLSMENTFFADEMGTKNIALGHFKEDEKYVARIKSNMVLGEQGIFTNSVDFAKWDKALYSNKILSCENLSKIFSVFPLSNGELNHLYGFGWAIMKKNNVRYFWHGGSGDGYTNLVLHLPDTKTTVLVLSNRNDGYDFLKLAIQIAKLFDKDLKL